MSSGSNSFYANLTIFARSFRQLWVYSVHETDRFNYSLFRCGGGTREWKWPPMTIGSDSKIRPVDTQPRWISLRAWCCAICRVCWQKRLARIELEWCNEHRCRNVKSRRVNEGNVPLGAFTCKRRCLFLLPSTTKGDDPFGIIWVE